MVMTRRFALQAGAALAAPAVLTHARAASRIRVGIPLPLTGVQSEVAKELQLGYDLSFRRSARLGGIEIEPLWQDDKSIAEMTASAVERFAKDKAILAATGIVGTPHAKAALPLAQAHGLPVIGLRSGAVELRDGKRGVYHLRASFADELTMMVRMIATAGLKTAVVFSDDAFGKSAVKHVQTVAEAIGLPLGKVLAAERNGADIEAKVASALDPADGPGALLMLMISAPMLKGLKYARERLSFMNPVFAMSFCATKYLAESKDSYLSGLGLVSAFPLPRVTYSGLANMFRKEAIAADKESAILSLTAFEGFVYGSVLTAAVLRAQQPTREAVVAALGAPMTLEGERVAFDSANVGYHYLQVIHKGANGSLKA